MKETPLHLTVPSMFSLYSLSQHTCPSVVLTTIKNSAHQNHPAMCTIQWDSLHVYLQPQKAINLHIWGSALGTKHLKHSVACCTCQCATLTFCNVPASLQPYSLHCPTCHPQQPFMLRWGAAVHVTPPWLHQEVCSMLWGPSVIYVAVVGRVWSCNLGATEELDSHTYCCRLHCDLKCTSV